jgi:tetratricopeptide (TPR) repeat protein
LQEFYSAVARCADIGTSVPSRPYRMNVSLRAAIAVLATAISLPAAAADAAAPAASAPAPAPAAPCLAPGPDRAANHACALALARHADGERSAGRNDAALADLARADQFSPEDLRFAMGRAGLALKLANQLTPAGIEAAAKATPDDVGVAMMHAELSVAKRDFTAAIADVDRVLAKRPDAPLAWEMRATADIAKPDFPTARTDVDHVLRLEPRSPVALRLRAILRNNSGDYAGALADYQAARALAPRPEDPFTIGSTQFLQRRFGDAAATLATRAPAAPDGTYWRLWRYLALARLNGVERASGALGPGTPPGTGVPWPVPVVDYLHGTIDGATLLEIAKKSQEQHDLSQVCEAHFYMAEDALLRQRAGADALFGQVVKECPPNFHEYEGAVAELKAAGTAPATVSDASTAR